jgi:hypothetical protein
MSNGELAEILPGAVSLRPPQEIMDEAQERAKVLAKMVKDSNSYVTIGGNDHLRVEAWITLGGFYGCSARVVSTEEVEYGGIFGFKAKARVTHDATGTIISEADAICLQDEANWGNKPLHQLMSMAETRAVSKALGLKFRSVVVLSGFNPTPAEEMDGEKSAKPQKTAPAPVLPFGPSKGKKINDPAVPDDDLHKMQRAKEDRLAKADRDKKWDEADKAMIEAIKLELAHRNQKALVQNMESTATPTDKRKPLTDHAWRDLIILWESEHKDAMDQAKRDLDVADVDSLPLNDRWGFFEAVDRQIKARLG